MPFHIDSFRGSPSVQAMHPAARAGYIYLLAACWQSDDCTLPNDPLALAELSSLGDELWSVHGPRIVRKFEAVDGRLRNPVLYAHWLEAKRIYESRQGAAAYANQSKRSRKTVTAQESDGDRAVTDTVTVRTPSRSADTITRTLTGTQGLSSADALSPRPEAGERSPSRAESIYSCYPRREGKRAGLVAIAKALERLRKGENGPPMTPADAADFLEQRAREYAASPAGSRSDRALIPHPSTWFNQSRYLDDSDCWSIEAVQPGGSRPSATAERVAANRAALDEALAERGIRLDRYHPSATAERIAANRAAIREAAAKRGISVVSASSGTDVPPDARVIEGRIEPYASATREGQDTNEKIHRYVQDS